MPDNVGQGIGLCGLFLSEDFGNAEEIEGSNSTNSIIEPEKGDASFEPAIPALKVWTLKAMDEESIFRPRKNPEKLAPSFDFGDNRKLGNYASCIIDADWSRP